MLFPLRVIVHSVIYVRMYTRTGNGYQTVSVFDNSGNYRIMTDANTADYIQLAFRYRVTTRYYTPITRPFEYLALIIPSYNCRQLNLRRFPTSFDNITK